MATPVYELEADLLASTTERRGTVAMADDTGRMFQWTGTDWDELIRKSDVLETDNDIHITDSAKGYILTDRTTGDRWRLYMEGGVQKKENLDA